MQMCFCMQIRGKYSYNSNAILYDCIPFVSIIQGLRLAAIQTYVKPFLFLFLLTHYMFRPRNGHHQVQNTNILNVHTEMRRVIKYIYKRIQIYEAVNYVEFSLNFT
jgi:hypothetical protein